MSEQVHKHESGEHGHGHEPWRKQLSEVLHQFAEADDCQRTNQEKIDKFFNEVLAQVVEACSVEAAREKYFVVLQGNGNQRTVVFQKRPGDPFLNINFFAGAQPSGITLHANGPQGQHTFLHDDVQLKDVAKEVVGKYLVEQLRKVKPKT